MPRIRVNGIDLHYEEAGEGTPWCSSTSSRGRRGAGTRRCASSPGGTGPSPTARAATRHETSPRPPPPTPRASGGGHSRGARRPRHHERSRVRPLDGRVRHPPLRAAPPRARAVPGGGGGRLRQRARRPGALQARRAGHGAAVPRGRHGAGGRHLHEGAGPRAVHGQGPPGVGGVPRHVRRPVRARPRPHHAGRPADAAVGVSSWRPVCGRSRCRPSS